MTALDELFAAHYVALVRLAVNLVDDQDSAEDVVQDVFAALDPSRIDDPVRYLRTAVVNRSRSVLRRRRTARAFAARTARVELIEDGAVRTAERASMLAAIDALPQRQREAVVLRYYQDLPVAEIARTLDTTPSAISSALSRALDTLATTLGDRDD